MIIAAFVAASIFFPGIAIAASGEIADIRIEPEFLVVGKSATIMADIHNTDTCERCYEIHWCGYEPERWIYAGETETETFTTTIGEAGYRSWTIYLYWDAQWPSSNVLLDTVTVSRRCFLQEEILDPDGDNIRTYIELEELGTNPNNADTDGDGKRDDVDKRPTIPEGSISISTTPSGASVYMNGKSMGTTPLSLKDMESDTYVVELNKQGYKSKTVSVGISPGGVESVNEVLDQLTGSIHVASDPVGADVYVEGTHRGKTPQTVSGILPGSYTVRLVKIEYNDYTKSDVVVKADQTTSVNAVLAPSDATPPDMRIETEIIDHNYNGVLEEGECIKIMYGASDESGVTSIKLMIDGQMVASQNAGGDYSMVSQPLSTGTHTIGITSTDSRGNSGNINKQIMVEPTGPSIAFVGTRTEIEKGEDAIFTLSVANPIGSPLMEVQLMLKPPSGVSVTSSHFVKAGSGIYTSTQKIRPGADVRSIEVRLTSNQVGTHEIMSEVHYQFEGKSKSPAKYDVLTLVVEDKTSQTDSELSKSDSTSSKSDNTIPGFGLLVTIATCAMCVICMKRRY